ncbi:MAG TPA: hypothetical protein VFQ80_10525, partial [Thermomicrobiales bacterium]|nr:hypothetical protein [Thermomicrobiales bacterium]
VDASPNTLMIEATGPEQQIDGLLTMLRGFGIRELVRTGPVAMTRGASAVGLKDAQRVAPEETIVANGALASVQ